MVRTVPYVFLIFLLGCAAAGPQAPAASAPRTAEPGLAKVPPTIGAQVEDLAPETRQSLGFPPGAQGAFLRQILFHGPAQRARLATGDLIQAVDGAPVATAADFQRELGQRSVGDEVRLSILRGQGASEVVVPLVEPVALYTAACEGDDAFGCYLLGAVFLAHGTGPESAARATELDRKACELGYEPACGASKRRDE
jgi:hypothetical protein